MSARIERSTSSISIVMSRGREVLDLLQLMANRLTVSEMKYGAPERSYPHTMRAMDTVSVQLAEYIKTGNTEYLIDAANYCLLEALCPSVEGAAFTATDSQGSAGRALPDGTIVHRSKTVVDNA